jgi:hypothetical protein
MSVRVIIAPSMASISRAPASLCQNMLPWGMKVGEIDEELMEEFELAERYLNDAKKAIMESIVC